MNGGKQPLSRPDAVSPMPFAPDSGQEEGDVAWVEVRPRITEGRGGGGLVGGGMGGAIFKLGKALSEFISTLSTGGGKGPIVQGSREGERGGVVAQWRELCWSRRASGPGEGLVSAAGPLNSGVQPRWGSQGWVVSTPTKPPVGELGSLASGGPSWGGGCGWDSHGLAFPGTAGPVPRLPAFQRLPWELLASLLSPFSAREGGGEKEREDVGAQGLFLGTRDP